MALHQYYTAGVGTTFHGDLSRRCYVHPRMRTAATISSAATS